MWSHGGINSQQWCCNLMAVCLHVHVAMKWWWLHSRTLYSHALHEQVNSVVTKYWHNDWMDRPLVKCLALQFWNTKLPYAKSLFWSCYDWCMQNTWQVNGFVYYTMVLFTRMMCECSQSFQLQCHLCAVYSWSVQSPHFGFDTCMKVCETPYKPCIFLATTNIIIAIV